MCSLAVFAEEQLVTALQYSFQRTCLLHNDYKDVSNISAIEMILITTPAAWFLAQERPEKEAFVTELRDFEVCPDAAHWRLEGVLTLFEPVCMQS